MRPQSHGREKCRRRGRCFLRETTAGLFRSFEPLLPPASLSRPKPPLPPRIRQPRRTRRKNASRKAGADRSCEANSWKEANRSQRPPAAQTGDATGRTKRKTKRSDENAGNRGARRGGRSRRKRARKAVGASRTRTDLQLEGSPNARRRKPIGEKPMRFTMETEDSRS